MNAVRSGAPLAEIPAAAGEAVASARAGVSDVIAGTAIAADSPRRKLRRFRLFMFLLDPKLIGTV